MVPPTTPEEDFEDLLRGKSIFYKAFTYTAVVLVGIVIGPFMFVYYGVRWLGGSIASRMGWNSQAPNG